jgi:hypothetical protein
MAKKDLYMEGRNCGMEYALRLVKQGGVEALEKEVNSRGLKSVVMSTNIPNSIVHEFEERTKINCIHSIQLFGLVALRNRFGFGRIRLQRFRDEFERLAEIYLGDPDVDMNVFRGQLEKVGLKVDDLTVKDV